MHVVRQNPLPGSCFFQTCAPQAPLPRGAASHEGRRASWQSWDWARGERGNPGEAGNGWREFLGGNTLIIEGCGSISKLASDASHLKIWVQASESDRRQRFHDRDSGLFDQYWDIWAAQEDEFYESENSKDLADFVIAN